MPQQASITANDRESTPVAHVFTPRPSKDDVYRYVESTGVPEGDRVLTFSMRRTGNRFKCQTALIFPILVTETINGVAVPKLDRLGGFRQEFYFDARSTTQERKNIKGLAYNLMAAGVTQWDDAIVNLEGVY